LKKTFEHWQSIGHGLHALRDKANRMGGRRTFDTLREQAGLGESLIDRSTVSKLLRVMDELPAVTAWRNTVTERQRFRWASPEAVLRHCPVFNPAIGNGAPKLSPRAKLQQELAVALEEVNRLKQHADGGLFDLRRDTADSIAKVIVGSVSATRARAIADKIIKTLKSAQAG
jgi:hypothetical protein